MTRLSRDQVEEILDGLRLGIVITVGGSRAHSVYGRDAHGWYREDFDEGAVQRCALQEMEIREQIADAPEAALGVLRTLRWRELREALAHQALPAARDALARWRALGDPMRDGPVLHAWLHPERPVDARARQLIAEKLRNGTIWHLFMETVGWSREPGVGRRGADFVSALLARLDEAPTEALHLRENFLRMDAVHDGDAPTRPADRVLPEASR